VHGYVHGYEEGFHIADLRLYAPRYAFNPPELDKKDEKAYRPEFGEKKFFRSGYRYGFGSGYADGMAGRKFRALELIRDSLTDSLDPKAFRADNLDRGLSMGYFAGRERGLRDGRLREPFRPEPRSLRPTRDFRGARILRGSQAGIPHGIHRRVSEPI
jgi:hypothetical protein